MHFDLIHANRVKIFKTKELADAQCPLDTESITYQSVFSVRGNGWVVQRRRAGNVTGYLEKEDA